MMTKMNDKLPATPAEARDALARFLEKHGEDFLSWRDGCIVVETYFDKQFRALGGDTDRLISFFEDYCNMDEASRKYIESLEASNAQEQERNTQCPRNSRNNGPAGLIGVGCIGKITKR